MCKVNKHRSSFFFFKKRKTIEKSEQLPTRWAKNTSTTVTIHWSSKIKFFFFVTRVLFWVWIKGPNHSKVLNWLTEFWTVEHSAVFSTNLKNLPNLQYWLCTRCSQKTTTVHLHFSFHCFSKGRKYIIKETWVALNNFWLFRMKKLVCRWKIRFI